MMNPTLDEGIIKRALENDPDGAQAEWLATFRTDLSAAFSLESLEACTVKGRVELPASPMIQYQAFVDPSGGKADAFTLAIGHRAEDKAIIDLVRAWPSPFNPKMVVTEIADVLKGYGVLNVTGDKFAAVWPIAEFREHGIAYEQCEQNKSELYLAFIPVTNSSGVELPDNKTLFNQLRRLERKRGRAAKDSIDHPQGCMTTWPTPWRVLATCSTRPKAHAVSLIRACTYHSKSYGLLWATGRCLSGFHMVTVLLRGSLGRPTTTRSGFLPHLSLKGRA